MFFSKTQLALVSIVAEFICIPFRIVADEALQHFPGRAMLFVPAYVFVAIVLLLVSKKVARSDKIFYTCALASLAAICASFGMGMAAAVVTGVVALALAMAALTYARRQSKEWNRFAATPR